MFLNPDDSLFALPANEFFDDECIHDSNSALGAFVQHHFADRVPDIQSLVQEVLADQPHTLVMKTPGQSVASFGIGKCVFLDRPFSSRYRLAMVSVTTQRADVGLRAEPEYIFKSARSLCRLMANNRINRLVVPVLGSGHGGLGGELALVCMLLAFAALRRDSTHRPEEVKIVVFRHDKSGRPSVPEAKIKEALQFVADVLAA